VIQKIIDNLIKSITEELKDNIIGIGIGGSYNIGKFSQSRPDVNIDIFVKRDSPEFQKKLADVFDKNTQNNEYNVYLDLRPIRNPIVKEDGKDLFVKLTVLDINQMNDERPFDRPAFVMKGRKRNFKLIYGENLLDKLDLNLNLKKIRKQIKQDMDRFIPKLNEIKMQYENEKINTPTFFNASLGYGKISLQQAIWLAEDNEKEVFDLIKNKEKIPDALSDFDSELSELSKFILNCRKNFLEWKNDVTKAEKLWNTSLKFCKILKSKA